MSGKEKKVVSPDKIICVDVDDTICITENRDYANSKPITPMIEKLREARDKGYVIVLHTARGQGRSEGNWKSVEQEVRQEVETFCTKFDVPFDVIVLGKPWAQWYVDDKAVRPDEFISVQL
jgi:capsule biosynthesis phosphatase